MKLPVLVAATALSLLSIGCDQSPSNPAKTPTPKPSKAASTTRNRLGRKIASSTSIAAPAPQQSRSPRRLNTSKRYVIKTPDGNPLTLHRRPQSNGAIITALPTGTIVIKVRTSGPWSEVMTDSGTRGFVSTDSLRST